MPAERLRVGIAGSGNIGTDLRHKIRRNPALGLAGVAGIGPASEGLALARQPGYTATPEALARLLELEPDIDVVFDATSVKAPPAHAVLLAERGIRSVDLTPAALGPPVVPSVNLRAHLNAPDVNLITCGAQATVPAVAAVARLTEVPYAETVSTVASRSAGPGTRQHIDEFTFASARSLETVGGAARGESIVILNPADPLITMRDTIYLDAPGIDLAEACRAIAAAAAEVARYVPGYRLRAEPLFQNDLITGLLEVEGAGDYLPSYAANLAVMTAAAARVAEGCAREADVC
jgi:acetaldehyde dehydrogenase